MAGKAGGWAYSAGFYGFAAHLRMSLNCTSNYSYNIGWRQDLKSLVREKGEGQEVRIAAFNQKSYSKETRESGNHGLNRSIVGIQLFAIVQEY
jgi:hypothetical protein